jgi:uncharacterized protein YndB with AHSA1/START domain
VPETPSAARTLEHEVRIEAPPETVFSFFTDPAKLVRWMGNEATVDPRPGGVFNLSFVREVGQVMVRGEFLEVVPFERIVFTWGFDPDLFAVPPASTRVEVSLVPEGSDTHVRLVHSDLPEAALGFHQAGWGHYMERLAVVSAGQDLARDEWLAPGMPAPGGRGEVA